MLFRKKARLLLNFRNLGKPTELEGIRVTSSGYYNIYYTLHKESVIVVCLWDGRRNPKDLVKILDK